MATPIPTNAKSSGEVALSSSVSRPYKTASMEKDQKDHTKILHTHNSDQSSDPDYAIGLPKYTGTFDTVDDKTFYAPIDRYEGRHRYDPHLEWEAKEEKRLVRKVGPRL